MSRKCSTCQHTKRAEIDRRLAAGEPNSQIAKAYGINPSSLHRHRTNCLKLASSNEIMKEASRGTAAAACLPNKEDLSGAYFDLRKQIDEIVLEAKAAGSLQIALSGLNSIRHTLDSLSRLSGFDQKGTQINLAVQNNVHVEVQAIAERLIREFDREPELKARIARALSGHQEIGAHHKHGADADHRGGAKTRQANAHHGLAARNNAAVKHAKDGASSKPRAS